MAKIARKTQLIFGANAGLNQIGKFGSLAAGSVAYTTDPAVIQQLSNYLVGWFGAVLGGASPAIEDMNALCYLFAYQIAYGFQAGVAEYDANTTYYTGSIANDGTGTLYYSLIDNNTGGALTDQTKWRRVTGPTGAAVNPATASPYTLAAADSGRTLYVNSVNGACQFTLPLAANSPNFTFTIKDVGGMASVYPITLARNTDNPTIEGVGANYIMLADYGEWVWECDGTNWWLTK